VIKDTDNRWAPRQHCTNKETEEVLKNPVVMGMLFKAMVKTM
jgi:hypothetical protein